MKIGSVFTLYDGTLPYQPGHRANFGSFVPPDSAPQFCPKLYFRFPVRQAVSAVVWSAPLKHGGVHIAAHVFNWSKMTRRESAESLAGESEGGWPEFTVVEQSPPVHLQILLQCAEEFWKPFTRLKAAPALHAALVGMKPEEWQEFLAELGWSRNPQTRRVWKEKLYIATAWPTWERRRGCGVDNYEDRVREMSKHGLPITLAAFKKRVADLKLPRMFQE